MLKLFFSEIQAQHEQLFDLSVVLVANSQSYSRIIFKRKCTREGRGGRKKTNKHTKDCTMELRFSATG